ncbi:hypothetical protein [Cupriavidus sp. D39]|uniref:hypothetical protein n=1 Tax=Cupriavidus sp. D39 TaxID=2997877 RepID=UPI002271838C|nr:hypothetical protein [Cupriavidus sp. D39]MCY0854047.1 hypothetical protein [Cupriavidus sp. D39]
MGSADAYATKNDLYQAYLKLFDIPFKTHFKRRALEELALEIKQWHVSEISLEAVRHMRQTGSAQGLRRGHVVPRIERGKRLFERETPYSIGTFLKVFFDNDHVTLVAASENNREGVDHWSPRFPVPKGRFVQNGSYRVSAKAEDVEWATKELDTSAHD